MGALPRHQCLIYEGAPTKHIGSIAPTIIDKLKTNNRCLYLNSPPMVAGMRSCLSAAGVDVIKETEKGALILSSDQGHLVNGTFDVDRMLALLLNALQEALADGYAALWATGDMTWEFGHEHNLTKLLEYECRLEDFMQKNAEIGGICQYHRDTLPLEVMQVALYTHQAVCINDTLTRLSPYYRYPLRSCDPHASPAELDGMLKRLLAPEKPSAPESHTSVISQ
jgi:hypothetical protein